MVEVLNYSQLEESVWLSLLLHLTNTELEPRKQKPTNREKETDKHKPLNRRTRVSKQTEKREKGHRRRSVAELVHVTEGSTIGWSDRGQLGHVGGGYSTVYTL